MEYLLKYFPDLNDRQAGQFALYMERLRWWNDRLNLISRQDTDHIELRHILHSLAIARWTSFQPGTRILDLGTGGGLPGIPLAIYFPEVRITMIDGTGKKIRSVQSMLRDIGLENAVAVHARAEDYRGVFDVVVSRAVAPLAELWKWSGDKLEKAGYAATDVCGLIALKGGDLSHELRALHRRPGILQVPITGFFPEPYFEEKYLIYVPRT